MSPPLSILLVEDHADTLRLLSLLLRRDGHSVDAAPSLRDALRLADGRRHDLVIADIGLPDGTGLDLIRELRMVYDVPAIALTGYGEDHYANLCAAAGFTTRMVKPITYERLAQTIAALRGGTRHCEQTVSLTAPPAGG
jgi:DNA-binding response OmpR family regulator